MKTLAIEWRHYDKGGQTCDRCSTTGSSVKDVVARITDELSCKGVAVTFIETLLPEERMGESNLILFNGTPIEQLIDNDDASENCCESCSSLTGTETVCRTIEISGETNEEIPADMIRQGALKAVDMII